MTLERPREHRDGDNVHEPVGQLTVEQYPVDARPPHVHENAQDDREAGGPQQCAAKQPRGLLALTAGQQLGDRAHERGMRAEVAERVDDAGERDADRPHCQLIGRKMSREPRREAKTHETSNHLPGEQVAGIAHYTSTA